MQKGPNVSASAIIRASGLVKRYVTASTPVEALRGVSLEVRRGERIALLGRSGSGKSTLLNIIGGLDRATAGDILVSGQNLSQLSSNARAQYRLATVGMIFQSFNLILSRTAPAERGAADDLCRGHAAGSPRRCPAGSSRRSALSTGSIIARRSYRAANTSVWPSRRALVNQPEILLADEPTGNLDSATAAEVLTILMNHVRQHGTTLILVTHDEELAGRCADRVLRLKDGQLIS